MQAQLRVASGKNKGNIIPLPVGKFLIGREEDCHLRPNSEAVSRHHCVFTSDEFAVRLRDLGSTNGTFVNGEKIARAVILHSGDKVSIGKLEFEVVVRDAAGQETQAALNAPAMDTLSTSPVRPRRFQSHPWQILRPKFRPTPKHKRPSLSLILPGCPRNLKLAPATILPITHREACRDMVNNRATANNQDTANNRVMVSNLVMVNSPATATDKCLGTASKRVIRSSCLRPMGTPVISRSNIIRNSHSIIPA